MQMWYCSFKCRPLKYQFKTLAAPFDNYNLNPCTIFITNGQKLLCQLIFLDDGGLLLFFSCCLTLYSSAFCMLISDLIVTVLPPTHKKYKVKQFQRLGRKNEHCDLDAKLCFFASAHDTLMLNPL